MFRLWKRKEVSSTLTALNQRSFDSLLENSLEPTSLFWQSTLSRLLLSYVPMVDFLSRLERPPSTVASFGSGSCAHESFLASALPYSMMYCHDITDRYIPVYLRDRIFEASNNINFRNIDLELDNVGKFKDSFDFVFSIQTLEHINDYRKFLELLAESVRPGGYLYLDAPYYHMDDEREDSGKLIEEREHQWQVHEHYHLGFSPEKLMKDVLLNRYDVVAQGYYAFEEGDSALMNVFRNPKYSKVKGSRQFTLGLAYSMKSALDILDNGIDLDGLPYFERPASAFRLLLKKVR